MRPTTTLLVSLMLFACNARERAQEAKPAKPAPAKATPENVRSFGAPLAAADALPLETVLAKADSYANQTVTVEGKVRRNCTRKGCWMELADSVAADAPGCRVTFKDYAFFVPLDSAGSKARVQGIVKTKIVSKAEVDHMESEGGTFASKQPDGTAREVRIVATGVELTRG